MSNELKRTGIAALALAAAAHAAFGQTDGERPAFRDLRYEEDWSGFRPGPDADLRDRLKHLSLREDPEVWVSFGGQARVRTEVWQKFGFVDDASRDDTFALARLRLHGDLHWGERYRAFVEVKSALASDRDLPGGRRAVDVDVLDIQNAFVDIKFPVSDTLSVTLRPGRQELAFGRERLVSPLDWANSRRTFEGARAIVNWHDWRFDGFWTRLVNVKKYDFNSTSMNSQFYGIYGTGPFYLAGHRHTLDAYWLGLHQSDAVWGVRTANEARQTVGVRVSGDIPETRFDYDVETAYQFGSHGDRDISAEMLAIEAGYTFDDVWSGPRFFAGLDYASGDNNPLGDNVRTFNQLFPLGHRYFGAIDAIGRQNIVALSTGISFSPSERTGVRLELHGFWRADKNDAMYDAGGNIVRAGTAARTNEIGQEVDLTVSHRFTPNSTLSGGYSRFFPGSFLRDTGNGAGVDFFFFQFTYNF